jgi:hypothetical protein
MFERSPNSNAGLPPVALLVDGENMGARWAVALLEQAASYGAPTVRRVYGKQEHIAEWAEYGFRLQTTRPGKNSADLLLTVEAMSLALREAFQTILVASSDRDFSYLAEHLRELGHSVVGVGESKAPSSYRASCSKFIELVEAAPCGGVKLAPGDSKLPQTKVIPLIRAVLPRSSLKDGWAYADWVEKTLRSADPSFSSLSYGQPTLAQLIQAVNFFELDTAPNGKLRLRERNQRLETVQPFTP